jgi:hypothetical protein
VRNDQNLRDLNQWYRNWAHNRHIAQLVLTETAPLRVLGIIVKPDSSDPGLVEVEPVPIDADHVTICKPLDRSKDTYVYVRAFIERQVAPLTGLTERRLGRPTVLQYFTPTVLNRDLCLM